MKKHLTLLLALALTINFTACTTIESIPVSPTEAETELTDITYTEFSEMTVAVSDILPEETTESETTTVAESETTTEETTTTEESTTTTPATTVTTTTPTTTTVTTTTPTTTTTPATTTTKATTTKSVVINPSSYTAINYKEQIGMWISFLEFQNILKGKSESQFRSSVQTMYDNCVNLGINTVYVHARSHGDAFYESDIYPWSKNITGTIDGTPSFDPYEILIEEAHKRGLSFHAWINPMRTLTTDDMSKISSDYKIKQWATSKNGTYIVNVGGTYWLSPAYSDVRKLIVDGAKEIVSKYKVDGVHIDDYFYQSSFGKNFDSAAFASSGYSDRSQFRLDMVSQMVKELYSGVKSVNSTVLFGISPAGNIDNLYSTQFADVKKWCSQSGYCDYIIPQVYWGFTHSSAAYDDVLDRWRSIHTNSDIKLIAGLAAYRAGTGEMANEPNVLAKQVQYFRTKSDYGGVAFFRYESLFAPSSSVRTAINNEVAALKKEL